MSHGVNCSHLSRSKYELKLRAASRHPVWRFEDQQGVIHMLAVRAVE